MAFKQVLIIPDLQQVSPMRVRQQDANGDYLIGQGQANFWINVVQGVAQIIQTRLRLWAGEWFLNNIIGTPWSQQVLGYGTASLRDIAVKTVILGTTGVTSITSYNSEVVNREFIVSGFVLTIYSPTPIPFGPVTL
jgi:hypothetical protein